MNSQQVAILSAKIADEKKAQDISILKMDATLGITDFFLICTATNERQVKTIADEIAVVLKKENITCLGIEGYQEGKWVLMDYGDIVIHIYLEELRSYYELDDLWADSPILSWETGELSKPMLNSH